MVLFYRLLTWIQFTLDTLSGNSWNPLKDEATTNPYVMTADMLTKFQTAMEVSYEVQWRPVQSSAADVQVFQDRTDKAIVTFREGTCYAAWTGIDMGNVRDVLQSWPALFSRQVCGSDGCCRIELGMVRAYNSAYVEEFETALEQCYQRCDDGCPVVLTGHSQGATIAPVAAVKLAKYTPILFTFGQLKAHRFPCDVLDKMDTYLRVVSLCESYGGPAYDLMVYLGSIIGRHTGTMIVVGDGGASTLGYNTDMWSLPAVESCHGILDHYASRVRELTPGPLDGFKDGSLCTRHIECRSRNCVAQTCS